MALKRFSGNPEYTKDGTNSNGRKLANGDIIPFTHNPLTATDEDGKVSLDQLKHFFNDEQDELIEANQDAIETEANTRASADSALDTKITNINNKIPTTASSSNQLADKKFVADTYLSKTLKGANSGLAELDANGKVPSAQLPSYVDDVLEYASTSNFPTTGESGKIYIAQDTNKTYRWSGSQYVVISETLALGETETTAYRGDRGKAAYEHSQNDDVHVTTTQKSDWNTAYTHSQTTHAPSNAEKNIINTVKVNSTALTPDSNRAVDITMTGATVKMTNYSKPSSTSDIVATDTANGAIGKLEKKLDSKSNWDSAYTHSQTTHAPSDAEKNVINTVKVNSTALTPDSNRAVNITLSNLGLSFSLSGTTLTITKS